MRYGDKFFLLVSSKPFSEFEKQKFSNSEKKVSMLLGNDLGGQYVAEKKKNLKLTLNNNEMTSM
jgi:hypothetical protein